MHAPTALCLTAFTRALSWKTRQAEMPVPWSEWLPITGGSWWITSSLRGLAWDISTLCPTLTTGLSTAVTCSMTPTGFLPFLLTLPTFLPLFPGATSQTGYLLSNLCLQSLLLEITPCLHTLKKFLASGSMRSSPSFSPQSSPPPHFITALQQLPFPLEDFYCRDITYSFQNNFYPVGNDTRYFLRGHLAPGTRRINSHVLSLTITKRRYDYHHLTDVEIQVQGRKSLAQSNSKWEGETMLVCNQCPWWLIPVLPIEAAEWQF